MNVSAVIAHQTSPNGVRWIDLKWGGSIEEAGELLLENYTTPELVSELQARGELITLDTTVDKCVYRSDQYNEPAYCNYAPNPHDTILYANGRDIFMFVENTTIGGCWMVYTNGEWQVLDRYLFISRAPYADHEPIED